MKSVLLFTLASALVPVAANALDIHLTTGVSGQDVFFASTLKDWDPGAFRMPEVSHGTYALRLEQPWLHELAYKFVVNGQWITDPANPRSIPDELGGVNSWMPLDGFEEDPWLVLQPGVPRWKEQSLVLQDWEGRDRTIRIITPNRPVRTRPNSKQDRTVLVYFQDGEDYLNQAHSAELLANFSAAPGSPLLIGVFVPPHDRGEEYALTETTPKYREFFVKSVVPSVEGSLGIHPSRTDRILIGDSLGGLISLDLAIRNPELFANVGSQSGAFLRLEGRILKDFQRYTGPRLRISLEVGTYERDGFIDGNRRFRDLLKARGWQSRYAEFPAVHDWISWRNQLRGTLTWLLEQ